MVRTERDPLIDGLRGFAIFAVAWIHTPWLFFGADASYLASFSTMTVVPLFFIISAYLDTRREHFGRRHAWRWLRLLVTLVAGSAGCALIFGCPLADFFSTHYFYWYLSVLIFSGMLWRFILAVTRRLPHKVRWCGILLLAFLAWVPLRWTTMVFGDVRWGIPWSDLASQLPFYVFGGLLCLYPGMCRTLTGKIAAIFTFFPFCASIVMPIDYFSFGYLFCSVGASLFLWWFFSLFRMHLGVLPLLGRHSLAIYLLNYPALKLLSPPGYMMPRIIADSLAGQWVGGFVVAVVAVVVIMAVYLPFHSGWKMIWKKRIRDLGSQRTVKYCERERINHGSSVISILDDEK